MTELPNTGVLKNVIITVATTIAGGIAALALQQATSAFHGPSVTAVLTNVPVGFGWGLPTGEYGAEELSEAIRSAKIDVPSGFAGVTIQRKAENLEKNKEALVNAIKFAGFDPTSVSLLKLQNKTSKVVSSVSVSFGTSMKVVGPLGGKVTVQEAPFSVRLDPEETLKFAIWSKYDYGTSSLKVIASDEGVPVTTTPAELPGIVSYISSQGILGLALYIIFMVGVIVLAGIPFAYYFSKNDETRRKSISQADFERMLGDVKAVYEKFRRGEPNPFLLSHSDANDKQASSVLPKH